MPLNQEEIKRRINAARLLRNISQTKLNQLGADDGFGKEEMGRVERGELDFRPGKHLDPLCRYLRVPRWWFTAEQLEFGAIDAPPSPDEAAALLAQQNVLLSEQSDILREIREEQASVRALISAQVKAANKLADDGDGWAERAASQALRALHDELQAPEAGPKPPAKLGSRQG